MSDLDIEDSPYQYESDLDEGSDTDDGDDNYVSDAFKL